MLQYNSDICNPVALADRDAALDWLLGFAVKLDYGDNGGCRFGLMGVSLTLVKVCDPSHVM